MTIPNSPRPGWRAAFGSLVAAGLLAAPIAPSRAQVPQRAPVQPPKAPQGTTDSSRKTVKEFREFTLDAPAKLLPGSAAPRYPDVLKKDGVAGSTLVMFVVDTAGRVEESTLKVVRTAHSLFVDAIKASLPDHRFSPARVGNRPVKQLVQVVYRFTLRDHPANDSMPTVKDVNAFEVVITTKP